MRKEYGAFFFCLWGFSDVSQPFCTYEISLFLTLFHWTTTNGRTFLMSML